MENILLQSDIRGKGDPLILAPGGLTGWKSWEPFVDYFLSQQKEVIRVQLLSVQYGLENRNLPDDYSVKTESRALNSTLSDLRIKTPVDIIGWSFGAFVCLDFALDNPEKTGTLTLIEPPALWVLHGKGGVDLQTQELIKFFESLNGDITEEMLSAFLEKVGFTPGGESPRDLPQWHQWLPYKQSLRNSVAVASHRDDLNRLRNLKSPVLLVKGTGSAPFLHEIIDGLYSCLPNSTVVEMAGGHAPHIVSREQFLEEWKKFKWEYDLEAARK
ncbi:MAG TPA: alpha/beta hydrolase [Bacteroidales bacterium]|nr:alpha/beta hydrolase [Bacteroidales bacterium]